MINVALVAVVLLIIVGIGRAIEVLHTCSREGCQAWAPNAGPGRLCFAHADETERSWA